MDFQACCAFKQMVFYTMNLHSPYFWLAIIGAIIFPLIRLRGFWPSRPYIKALMGMALALYCLIAPNAPIIIMAIGFALSALGDFLLDLPDDKGFTLGLFAFFAAHIAFIVYLWPLMVPFHHFTLMEVLIVIITILSSAIFYIWLKPSLSKDLIVPVAAYSTVIALMGIIAFTTTASLLIPLGALLFIASDVVLSIEKFKFKFLWDKEINWALYAGGQILLAIGVVSIT